MSKLAGSTRSVRKYCLLLVAISICLAQPFDGTSRARLALVSAASPPAGPIPSTLFGMHIILGNFPTVSFNVLRTSRSEERRVGKECRL